MLISCGSVDFTLALPQVWDVEPRLRLLEDPSRALGARLGVLRWRRVGAGAGLPRASRDSSSAAPSPQDRLLLAKARNLAGLNARWCARQVKTLRHAIGPIGLPLKLLCAHNTPTGCN